MSKVQVWAVDKIRIRGQEDRNTEPVQKQNIRPDKAHRLWIQNKEIVFSTVLLMGRLPDFKDTGLGQRLSLLLKVIKQQCCIFVLSSNKQKASWFRGNFEIWEELLFQMKLKVLKIFFLGQCQIMYFLPKCIDSVLC